MKPASRTMNVTSTLQGEKVGMSIDTSALAHIMSVLTDLYSDPEMAVVREYATNAYDAHVEAGVSLPIEVTLPSTLSPYLKIRDYGRGLDVDDIRDIYSRYGTSTKRDTDDLVGTLGLGCKSALTYTNQFTLQGIKNGKCTQVSVSRDEDGAGSMTIVASYDTDEASGVEVTIPAKSNNDFAEKAAYLFQFWPEGSVLVNGTAPEPVKALIEIDANTFIARREHLAHSVVVMGNVPYPMKEYFNFSVVTYVPMGAVQFTPSREALQMTAATEAVIAEIIERVNVGKQAAVERLVENAQSKPEALKLALEAAGLFGYRGEILYKGEPIPLTFVASKINADGEQERDRDAIFIRVHRVRGGYRRRRSLEKSNQYPISVLFDSVFLTGFTNNDFTPYQRLKLEQWWNEELARREGKDTENFMIVNELPLADWIEPSNIYSYEVVAAQKLKRETTLRRDGRPSGTYRAIVDGQRAVLAPDEIDSSRPIYYYFIDSQSLQVALRAHPNSVFVELTTNRVEKFKRLFPAARNVDEATREAAQAWADSLTPVQIMQLFQSETDRSSWRSLDGARVNDPDLKQMIAISAKAARGTGYEKLISEYRLYQGYFTMPERPASPDFSKRYPILSHILESYRYSRYSDQKGKRDSILEHLYLYVNAAYAAALSAETETN